MLDLALAGSAAALGLAGTAHCAVMCGGACAALSSRSRLGFHLARVASYALGGGLAAASVSVLGQWAQLSPALRPVWTLLHVAVLAWGIALLWRGRQPAFLGAWMTPPVVAAVGQGWQTVRFPVRFPAREIAAGGLWVALPCGLLQSALMLAAMANGPLGGAMVMGAFGTTSAVGLVLGPWAWKRWGRGPPGAAAQARGLRVAGFLLVLASAFALLRGTWAPFAAFCASL